jgi:5'-deoxynucleotidase YfbR-like HD superfamily hydrolase
MGINIQDIMRSGHTKRWNIVDTVRIQTLAEHQYAVAMIAMDIHEKLKIKEEDSSILYILKWALRHDVPEVVCGDMPTPTKNRLLKEFGFDMEKLYDMVDPVYASLKSKISIKTKYIVKMADTIESIWFLSIHGVGSHAEFVLTLAKERYYNFLKYFNEEEQQIIHNVYEELVVKKGNFYE